MRRLAFALPALAVLAAPAAAAPPAAASTTAAKEHHYRFRVERAAGSLYNPWTRARDPVELRAFRGSGVKEGAFVAPIIRVAPGEALNVEIDNRLEPCPPAAPAPSGAKPVRCFNDTNLHTHGLWVSPSGNSDNVLISIPPGKRFGYRYEIPADHPAGTFWYHPHRHGSGFVQVGSGMAGALIVTGSRKPTAERPGDVDILLKERNGAPLAERVMLFQQIQYGCLDEAGKIEGRMEKDVYVRPWTCAPGRVGRIETDDNDWDWRWSGRFTGINGEVQPKLTPGRAGRFERWRLVHAGTREPVRMRLLPLDSAAPALGTVPGGEQEAWIARWCKGAPLPLWHFASDGLTRSAVRRTEDVVLFPGDRLDLLTRFPRAGRYCLLQHVERKGKSINAPRMLAVVEAKGRGDGAADGDALLRATLIGAARRSLEGPVRDKVVAELGNGLKLSAFVWHKPIPREEVSEWREAIFNIIEPPETNGALRFHMNGRPYDHDRIDYVLPLGATEEWHVRSFVTDHPIHLHVNPFQVIAITDAEGRDVADPASPAYDRDYAGIVGEWKDTVLAKQGYRVIFRTRYERFTGDFVTHCHIMFHGDAGMMMNLRIADTKTPAAAAHH